MGKGKGFSIKQFLRALQRLNLTLKPQWWYSEGHQGCIYVLASEYPPKHTGWIPHCYQKSLNPACSQWMWLQPWSVVTFGFWITPDTGDAIFSKLTQIILPECHKVPECSYLSSPRNWNCNLFIHFRHMRARVSVLTPRAVQWEGGRTGRGRKDLGTPWLCIAHHEKIQFTALSECLSHKVWCQETAIKALPCTAAPWRGQKFCYQLAHTLKCWKLLFQPYQQTEPWPVADD